MFLFFHSKVLAIHFFTDFRMSRPEILYSCENLAKPILHDTILQLAIIREIAAPLPSRQHSYSNLLLDDDDDDEEDQKDENGDNFGNENFQVTL